MGSRSNSYTWFRRFVIFLDLFFFYAVPVYSLVIILFISAHHLAAMTNVINRNLYHPYVLFAGLWSGGSIPIVGGEVIHASSRSIILNQCPKPIIQSLPTTISPQIPPGPIHLLYAILLQYDPVNIFEVVR